MLASLIIKNVVLVDHLKIDFSKGLCALTGETGAGKSILLNSLGLALGNRADNGLVRKGEEKAQVIATFDLSADHSANNFLKENDIDFDELLILKRSVSQDGRSKAFVNDQPVSVKFLKELGNLIVEVHGQFETQNLFNLQYQLKLLDQYAGNHTDLNELQEVWIKWSKEKEKLSLLQNQIKSEHEQEAYLRESLEDLDILQPESGEEEKLTHIRQRLIRRDQIIENLHLAESGIQEIENISGSVWKSLERLQDDGKIAMEAMERANVEIQEVSAALNTILSDLGNNKYSLEDIDDRLFALKAQARKHSCSVDYLSKKRDEIYSLLLAMQDKDEILESLINSVEKLYNEYLQKAESISEKRKKYAIELSNTIMAELVPLKLDKTIFGIDFDKVPVEKWGVKGFDKIEFMVATNSGAKKGPLGKVASGGEMSRLMLAIKVVLAEGASANTLVFDEVDSGIGGATAAAVGERLVQLAQQNQVLVVTHSPQVAAMANNHWIVTKEGVEVTNTNIIALSEYTQRQEEIARMLAGANITKEARAAADKLLETN